MLQSRTGKKSEGSRSPMQKPAVLGVMSRKTKHEEAEMAISECFIRKSTPEQN